MIASISRPLDRLEVRQRLVAFLLRMHAGIEDEALAAASR